VVRVRGMVAPRLLTFAEARDRVERDWVGLESERLTHAMLDRARKALPMLINDRALMRLTEP
jgi:hypothetical protein